MKRINLSPMSSLHLAVVTLLTGWLTASALSQSSDQGVGNLAQGHSAPPIRVGGSAISGIPEDWSHRYVVFSDPGTEQEAIQSGRYEQWQKIVNEPRYVIHQMRKNARVQGPAAADVEARSKWISETAGRPPLEALDESAPPQAFGAHPSRPIRPSPIKADWHVSLGVNSTGLAAGHYPAKYVLSVTAGGCRDFVVFPTGAAGSATQATIVAFNDLYVGTCQPINPTNPDVFWAYNTGTGAIANLSPVLSLDGNQVAFVQTSGSTSSLVILKMAQCTNNCSVTLPDPNIQAFSGAAQGAAYRACANGLGACYITFALNNADSNSAPFYRYGSDILYVGDDVGQVHQFTGVFSGNPAEVTTGWPVNLGQQPADSPVYDFGGSNLIFVTTGGTGFGAKPGVLKSINAMTGAILTSGNMDCSTTGFRSPPLVDSSRGMVYVFVGYGCDSAGVHNSYINRFAAGTPLNTGSTGNYFSFGNSGSNFPSNTIGNLGAFDNAYLTSTTGNGGNLYACVNGVIFQLSSPNNAMNNTSVSTFSTAVGAVSSLSTCSPVTEFLSGGVDWLFVSVQDHGNVGSCNNGPCVFNYDITSGTGGPNAKPTAHLPVAQPPATTPDSSTSGIIIDNGLTTPGGQQIYFSTRRTPSDAVQASQSALQ